MSTPHNRAEKGQIAKTVLMPGDPLRAKFIAENFLENPVLVTDVRNIYGFTGTYKGHPVTVMASGMGMASIGIYSYELFKFYDVENIIRIGSTGSYNVDMKLYDVLKAEAVYSPSNFAFVQSGCTDDTMYPSPVINAAIEAAAEKTGITVKPAKVCSSDIFYSEDTVDSWQTVREKHGVDCVEMESFALIHNANVLHKNASCMLTVSDHLVTGEATSAEERQNAFTNMMKVALEAAVILDK